MRCKKCRCTLLTDFAAAADDEPLRKREEEESKGPAVIMVVNCHGGRVIPTAEICEELVVSNTCLALEDKSIIYIKEDSLPLWIDTRVQMVFIYTRRSWNIIEITSRCTRLFLWGLVVLFILITVTDILFLLYNNYNNYRLAGPRGKSFAQTILVLQDSVFSTFSLVL